MTSIYEMAEEALRSTSIKANFHRLTRLLMRGGVQLLRETLDSFHSPVDLPLKLADPRIQAQLNRARLTRTERDCLYPSPGVYGESNDFDITLIFKLFRTICSLTPPPGLRGWDDLPNDSDHTLVADLVRIKYYRNEIYGHRPAMEISDIDFIRLWEEIREALLRIATNISPAKRDEWEKSIDDLLRNPLTPDEERCIEELETWYKQDMDVKNELVKLRGELREWLGEGLREGLMEELREGLGEGLRERLREELRSQQPAFVVIQMDVAGCHQAPGSERTFHVPNLLIPEPEQAAGADDPEPNNPPDIDAWSVILSFKESVDLFFRYLRCKLHLLVRNNEVGSWHITVECSSLEVFDGLWEDYCSGHLNSVAQEILITPQVLKKLGLTELKLKTFIAEEKGKKLLEASSGAEDKSEIQALQGIQSEGCIEPDWRLALFDQKRRKGKEEKSQLTKKGNPRWRKSLSLNNLTSSSRSRFSWLSRRKDEVKERIDPELEVNQRVGTFIEDFMLEREFDAEPEEPETPEESSEEFDSQSDDDSSETGPGPGAQLDEETTRQNNGISKKQVREEPETFLNKALQESEKEQETALQQTQAAEENYQEDFSITAVRFHDGEKEEERREENFCSGLSDTEQRLREELTRTEIRVVLLSNQLSRKHQDAENFQRQIQKMKQQLTVREDRKENFRTQLDKEQRLRAELNERETTEILLRKQLREKDCQEASLQRTLCEQERQLEKERRFREELIEKEATEILLRKQLREMDCQEAHFRMQLRIQKQQLEEKVKGDETLGEQFQEMERRLREEITEKDARQVVLCEKITEKDQQLTEMIQQLTVTVEREEDLKTQIKNAEEQLRENEEQVENLRTNLKDVEKRLTQKEAQEENLRLSLEQMEQRMREELTQKETRETELRKQLREREEQAVDYQRHLSGMEQQLSEKNHQNETLLRQLREMEQRSREVTAENEMRENEFREQTREREQELREMAHQLTEKEQKEENFRAQIRVHLMEQRLREEMIEKATRLGEQLRERDQQIENFQMQFREIVVENSNLRQQVNLKNQAGSQSNDWVISRDDIQLTDKSLGAGGWGEVFEGRYCGYSVAVKRIHEAINSPYNQSLFQREIDIASRCRHPCLLQFIGATNDEESPLFVTELMESNLRELLGQRPLSHKEITVISLDVARALNYLHQKKPFPIFHRDVSSGNVLLWRQGDQWRGKVSDYGSAKFEEQFMSIGPGCFAYSAPEVRRPAKHTAKIDVYSFGVLLCEMCIQRFPDYQNRERQIAQITDHVLQDLVRRCLRSDHTERPDMAEIISILEDLTFNCR